MGEQERSNLEDAVIIIQTKLSEREAAQASLARWVQMLVVAFVVQAFATVFMSGIKWNQVDRLIQDVAHLEQSVAKLQEQR